MTSPNQPDPLSLLSQSLGAEYDQSREAQRERLIAELQQLVDRVPEQTELTNTRRYQVLGPILTLLSLALTAVGVVQSATGVMICGAFMSLAFALVTWQHRHAGQHPFMRLTHRQLTVDSLSAPVDLAEVVDIYVKDEGLLTVQKLKMSPEAVMPTHRPVKQVFGNQAMAFKKPPHIVIQSAGLMSGGRKLDCDDTAALLGAYVQAACALQQLDALRQHG